MDVHLHRVTTKTLLEALQRHEASLTRSEAVVFDALNRKRGIFVPPAELQEALYGEREDGGPLTAEGIVRNVVHRVRRKLPGLNIETKYYFGYRIAC